MDKKQAEKAPVEKAAPEQATADTSTSEEKENQSPTILRFIVVLGIINFVIWCLNFDESPGEILPVILVIDLLGIVFMFMFARQEP